MNIFKSTTIASAWRATSFIPYNPRRILDIVLEYQRKIIRPATPEADELPLTQRTPHTAKDLINHGRILEKSTKKHGFAEHLFTPILQSIKGSIAAA